MATENFAYDSPVYQSRILIPGLNTAGASAKSNRFAAFANLVPKSMQVTVVTAGTGTGNATVCLVAIAAGGTAITTYSSLVTHGTNAAGVTTNVVCTGTISQGADVYVEHGADAAHVFTIGLEMKVVPGASVTA